MGGSLTRLNAAACARRAGRAAVVGAAVLSLPACAGLGGPPSPPLLAYGTPDPNPAAYTFADTTILEIEAPGYGVMDARTGRSGTAELHFSETPNALDVQVRFTELDGRFRSGRRSSDAVSADDIGGPVGVALTSAGRVAVVDTPAVTLALLEVVGVDRLVRPFFVSLPDTVAETGARWTDTVMTVEETPGTITRTTSVVESTVTGDTVMGDRRLLRIETRTEAAMEVTGTSGGVRIEQQLSGALLGSILWDPESRLLVARTEAGTLSGNLLMPGTSPASLPVTAVIRRTVRLRATPGP